MTNKNPTVDDYIEDARTRTIMSDGDSRAICMLADEVIRLRNDVPCPVCKGTGWTATGETHATGSILGECGACKGHKGNQYKAVKPILE